MTDDLSSSPAKVGDYPIPDYQFWARMPGWRIREAAALIHDIDPDSLDLDQMPSRIKKLYRLLKRAYMMGEIRSPCSPQEIITFIESNNYAVPNPLRESLAIEQPFTNWRRKYLITLKKYRKLKRGDKQSLFDPQAEFPEPHFNRMRVIYVLLATLGFSENKYEEDKHAVADIIQSAKDIGLEVGKDAVHKVMREVKLFLEKQTGKHNSPR